jgi:hypothetical protein
MARELVAATIGTLGLRLHPEKTRVVHLTRGSEGSGEETTGR